MFDRIDIFRMSSAMASHAGRRQALAAENMANSDTPAYRAKRLPSFSDLAAGTGLHPALRATRTRHLHGNGPEVLQARATESRENPSPDGNTVSLELELLESVNAKREHDRAIAIYKSALTVLHTTLAR